MRNDEDPVAAIRETYAELTTHAAILRIQRVVVPLLEDLGYRIGREGGGPAANSAFILASEMEKRLTALALILEEAESAEHHLALNAAPETQPVKRSQ